MDAKPGLRLNCLDGNLGISQGSGKLRTKLEQAANSVEGLLLTPSAATATNATNAAAATTTTPSVDDGRWRRVRVHLLGSLGSGKTTLGKVIL